MIKELDLVNSDLILNSTRVLILISKFESKKSFKMNINKIMLYDFYMKFPQTMLPKEIKNIRKRDFNEYYSYFHLQPNRDEYNLFLRYLVSKRLVDKIISGSDFCYRINERGNEVLKSLESEYFLELNSIAEFVKKEVSKLSDSKIESEILELSLRNRDDY
ncbi:MULTISPECIES: ABC-three component system middle component 2 [Bacillus cereus group]|uniref:ABC-three component system middle component 2 n=1 Tax=Bacillus cereus group TaxID=86661 RepID=UPI000BA1CB26|nr:MULTISPECIES: ABC-three component system middle component 2 [Bacillus cereus group]WJX08196.1 hypothetical protein QTA68_30395 [Bacillus cereus]